MKAFHKTDARDRDADLVCINEQLYEEQLQLCRELLKMTLFLPATQAKEARIFLARYDAGREVLKAPKR